MLISQLQKTVGFGQMYAAFFSVHFSLSFALCFALLSPPPKICDFYFDKTEKKSKRTWSFLPEIREVEQKKIISLYKHENTLSFLHKNWRLILQSFWLFYLCLMILFNISWIWNNPTNIFIFVKFEADTDIGMGQSWYPTHRDWFGDGHGTQVQPIRSLLQYVSAEAEETLITSHLLGAIVTWKRPAAMFPPK